MIIYNYISINKMTNCTCYFANDDNNDTNLVKRILRYIYQFKIYHIV